LFSYISDSYIRERIDEMLFCPIFRRIGRLDLFDFEKEYAE